MFYSWLSASSSSIGGRQGQEDRVVAIPDLNLHVPESSQLDRGIARSYFAVFDGHGGPAVSAYLAKTFHLTLAKNELLASDPKAALLEVWNSMDGEIYQTLSQKQRDVAARMTIANGRGARRLDEAFPRDGSTATILLLVGNKLFAANCGDSEGILVKKDGSFQAITTNHDTLNPGEFERICRLGGFYRKQMLRTPRRWPWCCFVEDIVVGKPRVYPGGLLVTRAFGDFSAKVVSLGGVPGVILPDCGEVLELTIEEDWTDVIIASDGVWDAIPTREMPKVLASLEGRDLTSAADGRTPAVNESQNQGDASSASGNAAEDSLRLRQAQLQSTCAKLILSCVRHRYWKLNQAAPDNASAVILRFHQPTAPEVNPEGPPTGSPRGSKKGAPEGCPEESSGGSPRRSPEECTEQPTRGSPGGTPGEPQEGSPEGCTERCSEGSLKILPEGSAIRSPQGSEKESPEASDHAPPEGSPKVCQEGSPKASPEVSPKAPPETSLKTSPEGS